MQRHCQMATSSHKVNPIGIFSHLVNNLIIIAKPTINDAEVPEIVPAHSETLKVRLF